MQVTYSNENILCIIKSDLVVVVGSEFKGGRRSRRLDLGFDTRVIGNKLEEGIEVSARGVVDGHDGVGREPFQGRVA
jgi:hypothetical protein